MPPRGVLNARVLLNELSNLNKNCSSIVTHRCVPSDDTCRLMHFFSRVNQCFIDRVVHKSTFLNGLKALNHNLDLIWILASFKFLDFGEYLKIHKENSAFVEEFCNDLALLCLYALNSSVATEMCKYFLSIIFTEYQDDIAIKFCNNLYRVFTLHSNFKLDVLPIEQNYLEIILLNFLFILLTENSNDIVTTFGSVTKYEATKSSTQINLCQAIFQTFQMNKIFNVISEQLLEDKVFNWNNLSLYITEYLKRDNDSHKSLSLLLNNMIEKCLKNLSEILLYNSIIFAKVLCRETSVSYLNWFTFTFSSNSRRPLNTEEKANFFLSAMTKVVEVEPSCYLQTYLHKAPVVPPSCQKQLSEYLQLIKAHLISLNQSIEYGFFENTDGISTVENDINVLVQQYKATGKISRAFLASISFRRQYFEHSFLPKLLENNCGKCIIRHRIIKEFLTNAKISNMAFKNHLQICSNKN